MQSKRQDGVGPKAGISALLIALVAAAAIGSAWVAARATLRDDGKADVEAVLESRLSDTSTALQEWQTQELSSTQSWAANDRLVDLVHQLLATERTTAALVAAPAQQQLRQQLSPVLSARGYRGFFVIAPDGVSLASTRDSNTGTPNLISLDQPGTFNALLQGEARITEPQRTDVPIEGGDGVLRADASTMFVAAPIFDDGRVIAVLAFRAEPDATFGAVFAPRRWGETGEAFAVDAGAGLLTRSRFEDTLRAAGLVEGSDTTISHVYLANPGVDLTDDATLAPDESLLMPTLAATSLLTAGSGMSLAPYESYLGRPVVGAWTWNESLQMGVVVEISESEALAFTRSAVRTLDLFAAVALLTTVVSYFAVRERGLRRAYEQLNTDLARAESSLREANVELTHFAHLAAHDLRGPAARQRISADMLAEYHSAELNDEARELIDLISGESETMLGMIEGFRALSKVGTSTLERSEVDLVELTGRLVHELVPISERSSIVIDLPSRVSAYPTLVQFLFRNLIKNAVLHGATPVGLSLTAQTVHGETVYSVTNRVSADWAVDGEKLLQPFVRDSDAPGTGLGLSIVKRVVQQHRGWIDLNRTDDMFEVRFTLTDASDGGNERTGPPSATARGL